jgi:hypothetical protein
VAGGWPRIPFGGRLLLVGCGSVSRCLQPLLLRHLEMDLTRLTVLDFDERRTPDPDLIAAGTLIPHQNGDPFQQVNGIRPRGEGIWQLARHTEAPHV